MRTRTVPARSVAPGARWHASSTVSCAVATPFVFKIYICTMLESTAQHNPSQPRGGKVDGGHRPLPWKRYRQPSLSWCVSVQSLCVPNVRRSAVHLHAGDHAP